MATEERMQARIDELTDEVERLTAERDALAAQEAVWMRQTAEALNEVERLKAALEPFALLGADNDKADPRIPVRIWSHIHEGGDCVPPTMADCFRAAELLNPPKPAE